MVKSKQDSTIHYQIAIVVIFLMSIGTVFVFSASANINQDIDLRRFYEYTALRQLIFFPLAVLAMYAAASVDYRRFKPGKSWFGSPVTYILVLAIMCLALVLSQRVSPFLPKWVPQVNQHYRWIKIPIGAFDMSFQPSELAKWTIIIFVAGYCSKYADTLKQFWKRFVPICVIIGLVMALVIVEDFGTAAFIALLSFLIMLVGGVSLKHILPPIPVMAILFTVAIITSPTRVNRITAFLHPEEFTGGINYQPSQSLIALGSGGLWGKGLGKGISKYGHLPEDTTDFIFAIIGEELGFAGAAAVIIMFILFIWLGLLVVIRCDDIFGRLLASGIVLAIGIQAVLNIGVVTVVLPTKGIPLPFVSAGGTSMLLSAAAIGMLMNIAKRSSIPLNGLSAELRKKPPGDNAVNEQIFEDDSDD
ncbi:MAG: cell division protein FtsW [Candidatus Brocadiia bacterium]|nr:MAG: cell division protein FtsW [Candidatus Brocadiia bacterium]